MTPLPIATPSGLPANSDTFLCPLSCTQGWVIEQTGLNVFREVRCECESRDPCAPNGYVSEVQCWDCNETVTPETVRGLDGPGHPLCAKCFTDWTKPDEPVATSLGQLALLEAKAQLAADLAATDLDRSIFRELAREASEVSKTVQRERARRRAA